ncbi:uncharacterized protein LOC142977348 isoform X1 [Anticarsia gemmatalis]|uniref:uncharacterized protein LOC142977348 isoform X1 n=1 Tax=Anticarsia gemmatalis TaxID=129554 RepID=UPI003F75FAC2
MPQSIHREMAPIGSQSVNYKDNFKLPPTLLKKATPEIPNQQFFRFVSHKGYSRDDEDGSGAKEQGSFRKTPSSESRFLFKNVPGKESRRQLAANFRPQGFKFFCCHEALPTDISGGCSRFPAEQRLAGEDRSSPSLFSSECRGDSQKIFKSVLQWRNPPTNISAIWPFVGTPNVCSRFKLGGQSTTRPWYKGPSILRRLSSGCSGPFQVSGPGCGNAGPIGIPGLACELPEVNNRAYTQVGIPRPGLGHPRADNSITHSKGFQYKENYNRHLESQQLLFERATTYPRHVEFRQPCGPSGPNTLSQDTAFSEEIHPERPEKSFVSSGERGVTVVVEDGRRQSDTTNQEECYPFLDNRRSGCGLGGTSEQPVHFRQMGLQPKTMALQYEGNVCRLCSYQIPGFSVTKCTHFSSVRQQNTRGIHQESRRNSISKFTRSDNQVTGIDVSFEHNNDGLLSPRDSQRYSRLPFKRKTSARVASVTTSDSKNFREVGYSRNRPASNRRDRGSTKVRVAKLKRWLGRFLRRLQPNVGVSERMGVPSPQHDTQSTQTPEQCNRDVCHNSTSMDSVLLVSRSPGTSTSPSALNREPQRSIGGLDNGPGSFPGRQAEPPGVESWGWEEDIASWSREEKQLLKKSWRPSTLSTYNAPLRRWVQWCRAQDINCKNPNGRDVARFLASLFLEKKFAYNTILLHKSAIATYCATIGDSLSKNFFIQQVLKAIAISVPRSPLPKTPIWDVKILFNWLKTSSCSGSLFDISRRTALVLLLASGRRLHDLTLLELGDKGFSETEDTITFWPSFGSKTDSSSHRQSGWLLLRHEDSSVCPVTLIKQYIKASEARRSQNNQIRSLFISVTGKIKSASKTIIAGWVRSVFKLVKIDAAPGSIRSAVASRGWLDRRPVQEILERGNWRCMETFSKYYCKEVTRDVNEETAGGQLYDNFKPI